LRPARNLVLIFCVAALVVILPALRGPSEAGRSFQNPQQALGQTKSTPTGPNAIAGVEITAQALPPSKYCAFGPKAYVVYVPLDVTIANGRRTPIIITRYLNVQRILIGKSSEDIQAQKYELATTARLYRTFGENAMFGPQPSDDNFVILKHNQTYEFTAVEGVPVRNDPADKVPGTVYPGTLAMSIEVQTWPFTRDAGAVQTNWARFGDLISAPVISYPTLIRLSANPPTEKCGLVAP
jgi:hypothetical protein